MDLSEVEVAQIVALIESGRSQRDVARSLNHSQSTVQRVYHRFRETGLMVRRAGSGRRRKTSRQEDRFMVMSALRNRHQTAVDIKKIAQNQLNVRISEWTVRRRLQESNLRAYRPATGPKLHPHHRAARLDFARLHVNWSLEQWSRVLFSDECRMCLRSDDRRGRVLRRPGERYAQCAFSERVSYGGGSIMFWGGISMEARTELVFIERGSLTAARYVEECLEEHVLPYAGFIGDGFLLMQDNARPHTAASTRQYLEEVGIDTMDWPALSPDLNPIEHVWDELKRRVRSREHVPNNIAELKIALVEEWENIPQETLKKLIRSMKNRMEATIQARGGNTRY